MRAPFLVLLLLLPGLGFAAPAQAPLRAGTVSLKELEHRLWSNPKATSTLTAFSQDFLPRAERIEYFRTPKVSPFVRQLQRFWRVKDIEPEVFGFSRKVYPKTAPWGRQEITNGNFDETALFRAAVLRAAAHWADKDGNVDLDRLKTKLGTTRREQHLLSGMLEPIVARSPFSIEHAHLASLHEYLDQKTLHLVTRDEVPRLVPKDMHALAWVKQRYDRGGVGTQMTRVWARQHVLGNTLGFLDEMGIPADKTDVWGKVYSLDPRIGSEMVARGYGVHAGDLDPRLVERQVAAELEKIPDPSKITKPCYLVLDDGGELIETIARVVQKKYPTYAHLFAAVEQTQGGINRLESKPLPFPVVASGSSWGKREHGSAMFGYAVSREIERLVGVYEHRPAFRDLARSMTVLGYGEIGGTIARHFREKGYSVTIYDPDPAKRAQAEKDGMKTVVDTRSALSSSRLLLSAAGRPSFTNEEFAYLPNHAVVINAASANELPRIGVEYGGLPKPGEPAYGKGFDTMRVLRIPDPAHAGETIYKPVFFARDGGVINFPLEAGNPKAGQLVPGRYIQYQLGLLYLDVVHAMTGTLKAGFATSPQAPQEELTKVVEAQLAKTGESLDRPKWE